MPYPMDPGEDGGPIGPRAEHISVTEILPGRSYEFEEKIAEAIRRIKPRAKDGIVNVSHSVSSTPAGFSRRPEYTYSAIIMWEEL